MLVLHILLSVSYTLLSKSLLGTSIDSIKLLAVVRIWNFSDEVEIVIDEREISLLLLCRHTEARILIRRHSYIIKDILTVDVLSIILEHILECHSRRKVLLHLVIELCRLVRLPIETLIKISEHVTAHRHISRIRIFQHILRNGGKSLVGRSLVELISQGRAIETVQTEESCILSKRTARIALHKLLEVCLSSVVILEVVVAQTPVISYCIISLCAVSKH